MKTLFAVISYQGDAKNGNHDLIRETWGKDVVGADLRFFIGRRSSSFVPQNDEVLVDFQRGRSCGHEWWDPKENCCIDFWQYEMREILKWSVEQGYDFTYLCQTDTFLIPAKLMASGFEKYDYCGHFIPEALPIGEVSTYDVYNHRLYPWVEEGAGIMLSLKAVKIVLDAKPDHWYYGVFIGQALGVKSQSGEVKVANLLNFWNETAWHFRALTGNGYQTHGAGWMQKMYKDKSS